MSAELIDSYLADGSRRGAAPARSHTGAAGGAPCGDLVRVSLSLTDGRVESARFDAEGCAAAIAAGAAIAELVEGEPVLAAAAIGPEDVAAALGGLSPQGLHAAELASDALQRALTAAVGSGDALIADPPAGERILVALSGGVDSAVAALLERERGADVVAVTVKLWADRRTDGARSCCSPQAVLGARALAHSIGIPHLTMDLEDEFRATVVDDFVAGYAAGRTPNPCVRCNGLVRLDAMVRLADQLGAAALATGHYARVEREPAGNPAAPGRKAEDAAGVMLVAPADASKDQIYALSAVSPQTLAKLRFPLGGLTKPRVREIAAEAGLPVAAKPDSQDLCFLAGEGKRSFLARHAGLDDRDGEIVDRSGRALGRHRGHQHFTVGQRRGLGIGAAEPMYVLATDAGANRVVVGPREQLRIATVTVRDATLNRDGATVDRVRLRHRSRPLACTVEAAPDRGRHPELVLSLVEPAEGGVAPGQTASLMCGDSIVGHGTIA